MRSLKQSLPSSQLPDDTKASRPLRLRSAKAVAHSRDEPGAHARSLPICCRLAKRSLNPFGCVSARSGRRIHGGAKLSPFLVDLLPVDYKGLSTLAAIQSHARLCIFEQDETTGIGSAAHDAVFVSSALKCNGGRDGEVWWLGFAVAKSMRKC